MFWKKTQDKTKPLDGCCTKNQQIEMYRELYAKAAKERDEANARAKMLADQVDKAVRFAKEAQELTAKMSITNMRATSQLAACRQLLSRLGIACGPEFDWIKEEANDKEAV